MFGSLISFVFVLLLLICDYETFVFLYFKNTGLMPLLVDQNFSSYWSTLTLNLPQFYCRNLQYMCIFLLFVNCWDYGEDRKWIIRNSCLCCWNFFPISICLDLLTSLCFDLGIPLFWFLCLLMYGYFLKYLSGI